VRNPNEQPIETLASYIKPERKAQLDQLANLGTLLGIHDAETLLDIEQLLKTELPFTTPKP
jgi:hypothetical protein